MTQPVLEVRDLTVRYKGYAALDALSFEVQPGEIYGILGENGAGKTTLLRVLAGLLKTGPYEGEVRVDGQPVKLSPTEYRLLAYLTSNANRVILHRELLRAVWGPEYGDESEYLRVYVRYLRQKLEPDPANPHYLLTQPGAGYIFYQPEEDKHPASVS